jgi:hypothetical protein
VRVVLSRDDLVWAAEVGVARHLQALQEGRPDCYGFDGADSWSVHVEGACGELAFARATNREWDASVGRFRGMGGDVDTFQVRTRSKHYYELIIRPDADPADVYVLVTGTAPEYHVRGAARAGRVMRPEFLQTHGNRPAAYFVPHHELRSIKPLILPASAEV